MNTLTPFGQSTVLTTDIESDVARFKMISAVVVLKHIHLFHNQPNTVMVEGESTLTTSHSLRLALSGAKENTRGGTDASDVNSTITSPCQIFLRIQTSPSSFRCLSLPFSTYLGQQAPCTGATIFQSLETAKNSKRTRKVTKSKTAILVQYNWKRRGSNSTVNVFRRSVSFSRYPSPVETGKLPHMTRN